MPFILIVIGIVLIVYNYRAIKRNTIQFEIKDTEKSFDTIFKDNQENLTDYQIELGALRKNIGESLTELQMDILEIKKELNMVKINENLFENIDRVENTTKDDDIILKKEIFDETNNIDKDNTDVISEINFENDNNQAQSNKTESIDNLIKKGLTDNEICHELSVSKGEVLLVRELFKK